MKISKIFGAIFDEKWNTYEVDLDIEEVVPTGVDETDLDLEQVDFEVKEEVHTNRITYVLNADDTEEFALKVREALDEWLSIPENQAILHEVSIDELKNTALEQIKVHHATALREMSGDYSQEERDTFTMQLGWAEKYLAGDTSSGSKLAAMIPDDQIALLNGAGVDPADTVAKKIIAKNAQLELLVVAAKKVKSQSEVLIHSATNEVELSAALMAVQKLEVQAIESFAAEVAK